MSVPSVFEADLPTVEYEDAPSPDEAHRNLRKALEQGPIAMGAHGPEILSYELVRATLRDARFIVPPGLGLETQGITSGPLWHRASTTLLAINGDDHARLRRLVSKAFTPRSVTRLDDIIVDVINELIDPISAQGRCEVVADIARPYPVPIISALLGAPREDWRLFYAWADDFFKLFSWNVAEYETDILKAWQELDDYIDDMVASRRESLTDDLISELIRAEDDGDRLSTDELRMLAAGMLMAGTDTTRNQVAAAVDVFCDYPEQWELLAQRPELAMKAVEEVMRFCPVVFGAMRMTTEDVELAGVDDPGRDVRHVQHRSGEPRPRRVRRAGSLRHHARGRPADADIRGRCALLPRREPGATRAGHGTVRDGQSDAQSAAGRACPVEADGRNHRSRNASDRVRRRLGRHQAVKSEGGRVERFVVAHRRAADDSLGVPFGAEFRFQQLERALAIW